MIVQQGSCPVPVSLCEWVRGLQKGNVGWVVNAHGKTGLNGGHNLKVTPKNVTDRRLGATWPLARLNNAD
jgi:hypothetical protein